MLSINTIARVVVNAVRSSGSYTAFDTGLILAPSTSFTESKRLLTFSSAGEAANGLINAGFTTTDQVYRYALKYFGVNPSPARQLVSCYPKETNAETPAQALEKAMERTRGFYGVCVAGVSDDDPRLELEEVIRASEHPMVLFLSIPNPADYAVDEARIMHKLYDKQTNRAMCLYANQPADAAALMGAAMGLQASHQNSAFSLCYQTINGIQPQNLSQAEVDSIQAINGNVYITRGYTHHLLEKGTVASGMRYDEVLYMDMIAATLQSEAVSLIAENDVRLPQTDDTTAQFINRFAAALRGYTDRGVLATGVWRGANVGPLVNGEIVENGFTMWADSFDNQSDADRMAHKAMPISVGLIFAGSVESIVINVNVVI